MTYEKFKSDIVGALRKWFPEETGVSIRQVVKTNDRVLDGLIVMDPGTNMSPTIYLNPYYDALKKGAESFDSIVEAIFSAYSQHRHEESFDVEQFSDYKRARKRIVFRLLNRKLNEKLLADVPHIDYLDLTVVFAYLVDMEKEGKGSILIHDCHMKAWGKTRDDLYSAAKDNSIRLLPPRLMTMDSMLSGCISKECPEGIDLENLSSIEKDAGNLYVLTNAAKTYGASCILYSGLLKKLSDHFGSKLYVLPSSIHEVILVVSEEAEKKEDLDSMVREVNATQLAEDDILSDHAYIYSGEKDVLSM